MAASSVTGVGLGDSQGKYKRESNTGCCGQKSPEEIPIVEPKTSCYTRLNLSGSSTYKVSSNSRIRVCSS